MVRGRGKRLVHSYVLQLSEDSDDFSEFASDEENTSTRDPTMTAVRHEFEDSTWSQDFFTYDPKPREFTSSYGPRSFLARIPMLLQLFELFWPYTLLCKIVREMNRYATHPLDALGSK